MKVKKYSAVIILVCSFMSLFGQKHKLVTKYFTKTKEVSEKYTTLNKAIDGSYTAYFQVSKESYEATLKTYKNDSGFIKEKGFYKNGVKDSLWMEYVAPFTRLMRIQSIGKYKNDKKVGVWQTYIEGGNIIEQYNYDSNKHMPYLINVSIPVIYPEKDKEDGVQGTVLAEYSIEADCSIDSVKIINGVSKECDNEVMRALNQYGELSKQYKQKYNINCTPQKKAQFSFKFQLK